MRKANLEKVIILLLPLIILACSKTRINNDAQSLTVKNNNYCQKFISKNSKNLNEIVFDECNMQKYDLSKINSNIEIITIIDSDSSELYISDICTCSQLVITRSKIKQLNLEKFPNIKDVSVWYTPLESCYIPYKNEIQSFNITEGKIDDFQSLKNLRKVTEFGLSQSEINKTYDVSFIKDFSFLTKARFSSNFYVTDDIRNVVDLTIDGVKNFNPTSSIMKFKNLRKLYYDTDYEENFPVDLVNLKELEELSFFYTTIKDFPADFSNFRKLKKLMIVPFKKTVMPKEIIMPATLTNFYTANDCENIDYCNKMNPNVEFNWNLEL